jgi:hypothetical protein
MGPRSWKFFAQRTAFVCAVLVFVSFSLVACASAASAPSSSTLKETPSPPMSKKKLLQAIQPPPTTPPSATADGVKLTIAQSEWWNEGKWTKNLVTDPRAVPVSEVHLSEQSLTVTFDSDVVPSQMLVSVFDTVDAHGLPRSQTGRIIDCLKSRLCEVTPENGDLTVTISKLSSAKIVVFRLAYVHAGPSDSTGTPTPPIMLSASWAVRISASAEE